MTARYPRSFTVATHNMTEGPVTPVVRDCDVVLGQEIDQVRIRRGLPRHRTWFPHRDPHQSISWNPEVFAPLGIARVFRLHRSGKDEGWPFPTPARYLLRRRLTLRATGLPVTFFGLWLLNSWDPGPDGRDEHTQQRHHIVADHCLPLIAQKVAPEVESGRAVVLDGDLNSVAAKYEFPGLVSAGPEHGLDRVMYSPQFLTLRKFWEGPTTGVGPQLRHHSRHAEFETKDPR